MTATRRSIQRYVERHPGVYVSELTRALDLAPGQVQYHLHRLQRSGTVSRCRLYGRTHYVPAGFDAPTPTHFALLHHEAERSLLARIARQGPVRTTRLDATVDIARSTLAYHIDHLVETGLVEKEYGAYNRTSVRVRDAGYVGWLFEEAGFEPPEVQPNAEE